MSLWYGGRLFRAVTKSENSQISSDTIFKYEQYGWRVTATYSGGDIEFGHLIGKVDEDGVLDMRYHHIDKAGQLRTGSCVTKAEMLPENRMRLHETWQWTDGSSGTTILDEI